ncbi:MAG: YgjV family protein [Acidobacteria bacterium]|nr:YgjV family protein [Acidobacteriota bacterium]
MLDWLGWIATAIFAASYFCKQPAKLCGVQALAALVWIGYGVLIKAPPVIVANLVVAIVAAYSAWQQPRRRACLKRSGAMVKSGDEKS